MTMHVWRHFLSRTVLPLITRPPGHVDGRWCGWGNSGGLIGECGGGGGGGGGGVEVTMGRYIIILIIVGLTNAGRH